MAVGLSWFPKNRRLAQRVAELEAQAEAYRQAGERMAQRYDALWAELAKVSAAVDDVSLHVTAHASTFSELRGSGQAMAQSNASVGQVARDSHQIESLAGEGSQGAAAAERVRTGSQARRRWAAASSCW
jgi:chromosome segregation ATPase